MSYRNSANDQMMEVFLFEISSLLETLDDILLACEKNQSLDEDSVGEIFRIMHTIKGSSAMMDFTVVSNFTHRLEDTFFYIRDNGIRPELFTELFDLMLSASDFLKSQVEAIQNGAQMAVSTSGLNQRVETFLAILSGTSPGAAPPPPASAPQAAAAMPASAAVAAPPAPVTGVSIPSLPAPPPPPVAASEPEAFHPVPPPVAGDGSYPSSYRIEVLFEEDCGMENVRAFMLLSVLGSCCTILHTDPPDVEHNPETAAKILMEGFSVTVETEADYTDLQELVDSIMHVKTSVVTPINDIPPAGIPQSLESFEVPIRSYHVRIFFDEDCGMENLRAFMLVNSLRSGCNILDYDPPDIETNPGSASIIVEEGFVIRLETPFGKEDLQDLLDKSMYVRTAQVDEAAVPAPPVPPSPMQSVTEVPVSLESVSVAASAPPAAPSPAPSPTPAPVPESWTPVPEQVPPVEQSPPEEAAAPPVPEKAEGRPAAPTVTRPVKQNLISVSLSKLDELMDLMGELVITEAMVIHSPDLKQGDLRLDSFKKSSRQLIKLTDELQDMVMSIRMIPVSNTFQKMQRVVRDMSRSLGKEVQLLTEGEDTDIDKAIIDGISDPIMHLVRNSMDHGIESPDEREAAGKPREGTITLSARNTGGEILITVSDDGRGLDADAILAKAERSGILTKPASEYTEREAYMLLCLPGFSTKKSVTEYSGRGVGMDVVKKNVEKIGGTLVIDSERGEGSVFNMKIPLTLAIVEGMEISVGESVYTLPIVSINESFKVTPNQVFIDTNGNEMIMIRGDVYPIVRLNRLYQVPCALTDLEEGIVIWVQSGDRSFCLFVDALVGEQQIVVKPLPVYLKQYNVKSCGISGCTILGDGTISMILDVGSIFDMVMERGNK